MKDIMKSQESYLVYEEKELGILVAIAKSNQKMIKNFWKSKDKSTVESKVPGYPFIQTEEQESLKIDFSQEEDYAIANLSKFE